MAQATWEKPHATSPLLTESKTRRLKFLIGGILILGAVLYLIVMGTTTSARYFISVEELVADEKYVGESVRITGAVVGDTIVYQEETLVLDFNIAHFPEETNNIAEALYLAANNPGAIQVPVHVVNEVKPDLLQHEAQAIITGTLGEDGIFYASELLLKCPSRYEETAPEQLMRADG